MNNLLRVLGIIALAEAIVFMTVALVFGVMLAVNLSQPTEPVPSPVIDPPVTEQPFNPYE